MLIMHLTMSFLGDDIGYSKILSNHSTLDFLISRYYTWSSRGIIELVLIHLARENFIIWKILDSILYTLGFYLVIKFINPKNDKTITLLGMLLFLMYPYFVMAGAGWISTTLNYSWCFIFGLISFIPIINEIHKKPTSNLIYIISFLSLIYATNQEQCCILILGLNGLYLIYTLIKKQNINKYNILASISSIISLVIILNCPGNAERLVVETGRYFVGFGSLGLIEKLYLGTIPTIGIFLHDKILFTVFYIILSISTLIKTENKYLKYICYFNIILIICLVLVKTLIDISSIPEYLHIGLMQKPIVTNVLSAVNATSNSLGILTDTVKVLCLKQIPSMNAPAILAIIISIYLLLSSALMIFKTFGKEYLLPLFLFLGGFVSRLAVGFSPTVFESGPRTAFFFYMIIIMITLMLIKKLYDDGNINEIWDKRLKIIFTILGIFTFLAVFAIIIVMF